MSQVDLVVDWCSHAAAKYAVEHWHYSGVLPAGKLVKVGAWEFGDYVGCVLFSLGAGNLTRGEGYGLKRLGEIAELGRVALKEHKSPTSKIVAAAIKMVRKQSPELRMIISFSDEMGQGHMGILYQALNFIYAGTFQGSDGFVINGQSYHNRSVHSKGWVQSERWLRDNIDPRAAKRRTKKHRYLYPLDRAMRRQILPLAKPYPKRAGEVSTVTRGASSPESQVQALGSALELTKITEDG